MQEIWGFVNMAVTTIPLKKAAIHYDAEKPGLMPVLHYGTYCPKCQRNYWLGWEPDVGVLHERKQAVHDRMVMAAVVVFALAAGVFFVAACLLTYGGRL
jgi:hypothetical protein